jgi:hypothetical protein
MPIPLTDLDDRSYDDLVQEIIALIPRYAPNWTDHNATDPGIMLIELFSWLAEAMMYRLNRVPVSSVDTFLKMLNGHLSGDLSLKDAQAATVLSLRDRFRAITAEDFESLVLNMTNASCKAARVKCLPELDLTADDPYAIRTGHVSLILVPWSTDSTPSPNQEFIDTVLALLNERRLITTKVHVVGPVYVDICLQMTVVTDLKKRSDDLSALITGQLNRFFHPLEGGVEKNGWPFGRSVYASEVYQRCGSCGVSDVVQKG